tara:strand:+ start:21 stop:431 length:411 start_codon:yes stop_codon:yes gene_type:complete
MSEDIVEVLRRGGMNTRALQGTTTPTVADKAADEILRLRGENTRLTDFCKEFVWGEDHPAEYKMLHEKLQAAGQKVEALEKEIRRTPRVKLADLEDKIMSLWPPAPSDPYRVKTLQEFRELTLPFIVLEPAAGEGA